MNLRIVRHLQLVIIKSDKYIYPGTSDAVGYFKYIYTIPETPGGSIQNHKAGNAASPAEKYHLEVVFVPYTVDERLDQNPGITSSGRRRRYSS